MDEISFERVRQVWEQVSERKNTLGLLEAFKPPVTDRWLEGQIDISELGDLRFIGGAPGDKFTDLTNGLYAVKSVSAELQLDEKFKWDQSWRIICLQDPQFQSRVIIDGNGRALDLFLQKRNGVISENTKVGIIVGELNQGFVFRAKPVAPLWK